MAERSVALIIGANRGIGLGVAREFLARGWAVIATARRPTEARDLAALAARHPERAEIESFAEAMKGRTLDVALINAGVAGPAHRSADAATIAEIGALMYTNAIAPIRLARDLQDRIRPGSGVLAFTTSAMGSVSLNSGGHELYRASTAA